jgi:hypothetical protein
MNDCSEMRSLPVQRNLKWIARGLERHVHPWLPCHVVALLDVAELFRHSALERPDDRREIVSERDVERGGG